MQEGTKVNLQERVTLYAPANAKNHSEGEAVQVGVVLVEKFESLGYTRSKLSSNAKKPIKE
jgi:hypothetical protein